MWSWKLVYLAIFDVNWQIDRDCRASIGVVSDLDFAAVTFHNAMCNAQAEARAALLLPRRIEGVERSLPLLDCHSWTIVFDGNPDTTLPPSGSHNDVNRAVG